MSKLPSRRILILIACTLSVMGIILVLKFDRPQKIAPEVLSTETRKTREQMVTIPTEESEKDTDGDGLKDWEESLWKTDPRNPDTDGDGTPDGEEVKNGRNPVVKGPNDEIVRPTSQTQSDTEVKADSNLSVTEQLSHSLFEKYTTFKKAGINLDDADDLITADILKSVQNTRIENTFYPDHFTTTPGGSTADIKNYGNELGKIFVITSPENPVNELQILEAYSNTNNPEELEKLGSVITSYDEALQQLTQMTVPQKMLGFHVQLANSWSGMKRTIEMFKEADADPVKTMAGIKLYYEKGALLSQSFITLDSYFSKYGIGFSSSEYGSIIRRIARPQ